MRRGSEERARRASDATCAIRATARPRRVPSFHRMPSHRQQQRRTAFDCTRAVRPSLSERGDSAPPPPRPAATPH
ncbi:hypothetical protein RTBOTA2_006661 [Rhodotorula toruloides]|nr:hypothetical protein RTBOTA2_006661 [Rhodotorula toruloides]